MKNIIIILLSLVSMSVIAQTSTVVFNKDRIDEHGDAFQWRINLDTLSGETTPDTVIVDGDTITTNYPDTLYMLFNPVISKHYTAKITMVMDTIVNEDTLEGAWNFYNAPCQLCPGEVVMNGTVPALGSQSIDTAELTDLKTYLRVIVTDGTGILRLWLTLIPF